MVVDILGVVNDVVPVPPVRTAPPVAAAYQSTVSPAPALADMVTVPVPHLEPGVTEVIFGSAFTVTDIKPDVMEHPTTSVTVTLYEPDVAVVALGIEGF